MIRDSNARPQLPKWPFYLGDLFLLSAAVLLAFQADGPLSGWQFFMCFICIATGAFLFIIPFILEFRATVGFNHLKLAQLSRDAFQRLEAYVLELQEIRQTLTQHQAAHQQGLSKIELLLKHLDLRLANLLEAQKALESLPAQLNAQGASPNLSVIAETKKELEAIRGPLLALNGYLQTCHPLPPQGPDADFRQTAPYMPSDVPSAYHTDPSIAFTNAFLNPQTSAALNPQESPCPTKKEAATSALNLSLDPYSLHEPLPDAFPNLTDFQEAFHPTLFKDAPRRLDIEDRDSFNRLAGIFSIEHDHFPLSVQAEDRNETAIQTIVASHLDNFPDPFEYAYSGQKNIDAGFQPLTDDFPQLAAPSFSSSSEAEVIDPREHTLFADQSFGIHQSTTTTFDRPLAEDNLQPLADPVENCIPISTTVIAHVMTGIGKKPYIRGKGANLSWEQGAPMEFIETGKWQWRTTTNEPLICHIYKNDEVAEVGDSTHIEPGQTVEINPQFS